MAHVKNRGIRYQSTKKSVNEEPTTISNEKWIVGTKELALRLELIYSKLSEDKNRQ